ncbi:MAG: zinc-binding dehydrogenase [Burkholderiales bacterium]|nr:zinc-binding dehydrogenase [Burkholderiales bacterium]
MRAVVLRQFGPPENMTLEDVPVPKPRPGEALLRVGAVSVDLYQTVLRRGGAVHVELPRIMGNGIAGKVVELAPDANGIALGQRVVVCNNVSCGDCRYCRSGRDTLCVDRKIVGGQRDGGYAEFVAVPARDCVVLPDSVSFEDACLIPNTIGPVVKACSHGARIRPAENAVIVGAAGGMGIHAVQAARVCGARVIAATRTARNEDAVRAAGADVIVTTSEGGWAEQVRRHTGGWGAEVVLDFVATQETLQASLAALGPGGRLVIMGYFPRGSVFETPTWAFSEERTVTGNRSAGRRDVEDALALIRDGRIKALVHKSYPLHAAVQAQRAFEAREIVGRAVLVP